MSKEKKHKSTENKAQRERGGVKEKLNVVLCSIRKQEGQGREYTEEDSEYVPTPPTTQMPPQSRQRRTRGSAKNRASSVPVTIPRRSKKRILPVINEEASAANTDVLGKELNEINGKNLQKSGDAFNGILPQGVLPMYVKMNFTAKNFFLVLR